MKHLAVSFSSGSLKTSTQRSHFHDFWVGPLLHCSVGGPTGDAYHICPKSIRTAKKPKWDYCWASLTKCESLFWLAMTTLRPFHWSCNWQTWWWKTTASSRATPQNSQGITTSPSRGLLGGLSEDRQTDCGAESMFEAIVSELVSDTPEVLLFIPPALGGDAGCLLKDAKAEAGLQPVWNTQTKQWV